MKRLLLFGLLGPVLGFLVLCVLDRPLAGDMFRAAAVMLPLMYVFAIGPLLLCAFLDFYMDGAHWWERLILVAFVGFITITFAFIVVVPSVVSAKLTILRVGLVGAIPAALCSLLSNIITSSDSNRDHNISAP